jgi:hypothetical protein
VKSYVSATLIISGTEVATPDEFVAMLEAFAQHAS